MDNNHFKDTVSQETRQKLLDLTEAMKDQFDCFKSESYGDKQISEISGNAVSGFIPFQDGGYELSEFIRFDSDPSYHVTSGMTEAFEKSNKYCMECFLEDNGLDAKTSWDDLTDEQQEELSDYEQEWFDPALVRFECWIERDKGFSNYDSDAPQKVFMRLSVNYSDAPYYRSKSDETITELSLTLREFMRQNPQVLVKQFGQNCMRRGYGEVAA